MANKNLPDLKKIVAPIVAQEVASGQKIVYDETSPSMAVFATDDGTVRVEARLRDGSVWLSQKLMAQLYGVSVPNISQHLKAIFDSAELVPESVIKEYLTTATDGKNYKIKLYSLDAIIHVGYRVRSSVGALFRAWATERLREYMVKGFTMDDDRLKYEDGYAHHFEELLARIRDIRSSEMMFYRQVRDVIAASSVDYALRKNEEDVKKFFAHLQDCMLYAVCGHTAAEIKCFRADAEAPNMGLTHWRGDVILVQDIDIAKNFLNPDELGKLNRLVSMFLDHAELRASNHQDMTLADWQAQAQKFLTFYEYPVLQGYGTRRQEQARKYVREQFALYKDRIKALHEAEQKEALEDSGENE